MAVNDNKNFIIPSYKRDLASGLNIFDHFKTVLGIYDAYSGEGGVYERNVPIVPNCIEPEDNEIVVKQYNIARMRTRLKLMRAEARLMVTNKRIIFRAAGKAIRGNTLQEHQFNLDELGGVEMQTSYKFSFLNFIGAMFMLSAGAGLMFVLISFFARYWGVMLVGILLGLLGLVPTGLFYKRFWLKCLSSAGSIGAFVAAAIVMPKVPQVILFVLAAIAGLVTIVNWILLCFVPNLKMSIKVKGAHNAINIEAENALAAFFGVQAQSTGFAEVMPWEDTTAAINELGTMIDDLIKNGDYAVEKWMK